MLEADLKAIQEESLPTSPVMMYTMEYLERYS